MLLAINKLVRMLEWIIAYYLDRRIGQKSDF